MRIPESHPRKRLVQSFLYTLILYKTPIQTYRKSFMKGRNILAFVFAMEALQDWNFFLDLTYHLRS